jgi:hypothetical protein
VKGGSEGRTWREEVKGGMKGGIKGQRKGGTKGQMNK